MLSHWQPQLAYTRTRAYTHTRVHTHTCTRICTLTPSLPPSLPPSLLLRPYLNAIVNDGSTATRRVGLKNSSSLEELARPSATVVNALLIHCDSVIRGEVRDDEPTLLVGGVLGVSEASAKPQSLLLVLQHFHHVLGWRFWHQIQHRSATFLVLVSVSSGLLGSQQKKDGEQGKQKGRSRKTATRMSLLVCQAQSRRAQERELRLLAGAQGPRQTPACR